MLGKLGLFSLILASAWFIKLAFDRQWINESGRIFTGLIIGYGILAGGIDMARRNYRILAPGVIGTGVAIVYISIFGAYYFYDLLGIQESFVFLVLLSIASAFFAVRGDSEPLYIFSLVGGLLAPLILSRGENSYRFLFSYMTIILVGYLLVSRFRAWRVAPFVLFTGVHLVFGAWLADRLQDSSPGFPLAFVGFLFAAFVLREVFLVARHRAPSADSVVLLAVNTAFAALWIVIVLAEFYPRFRAHGLLLLGAAVLLSDRYLARHWDQASELVRGYGQAQGYIFLMVLILTGLSFGTGGPTWILFGLSIAIALLLVGSLGGLKAPVIASVPVWILITPLVFFALPRNEHYVFLWNERFALAALGAVALAGAYLLNRSLERRWMRFFVYGALFYIVFASLLEVRNLVVDPHLRNLCYSYVLAGYAIVLLTIGFLRGSVSLRMAGIVIASVVVLKLYLYDVWTMSMLVRIIAFFSLGLALVLLSLFYQRLRPRLFPSSLLPVFLLLGLAWAFPSAGLSAESFSSTGYHFYKSLPASGLLAREAPPAYGVFELDDDVYRDGGGADLRIVLNGSRTLPYFTRPVHGTGIQGETRPEVIYSGLAQRRRIYVLRLDAPPDGARYTSVQVGSNQDYESGVHVSSGPDTDRLAGEGFHSLYSYGSDTERTTVPLHDGQARYVRLEFDSEHSFYFPAATYRSARETLEITQSVDPEEMETTRDPDLQASVYYFENARRRNIDRLVLRFQEERFDRTVEIQEFDADLKEYTGTSYGRISSRGTPDAPQSIPLEFSNGNAIKVYIYDEDNDPLTLIGFEAVSPREEVVFELPDPAVLPENSENEFRLYYGNEYARRPSYEIRDTYSSDLRHARLNLGPATPNEDFGYSIVEPPLSSWIIRVLFVLLLLGVSYPAYRVLARFAEHRAGSEPGQ